MATLHGQPRATALIRKNIVKQLDRIVKVLNWIQIAFAKLDINRPYEYQSIYSISLKAIPNILLKPHKSLPPQLLHADSTWRENH